MDIKQLCKICAQHDGVCRLFQTRIKVGDSEVLLSEAFIYVTNLKVRDWPSDICTRCLERLTTAFTFKRQAEEVFQIENLDNEKSDSDNGTVEQNVGSWGHSQGTHLDLDADADNSCVELDMQLDSLYGDNIEAQDGVQYLTRSEKALLHVGQTKRRVARPRGLTHKCQVCERIFGRKSNLVDHLRLHANVRLFRCNICSKSFVQIANYRAHMRTHTLERPYQCDICQKTYTQSSALKIHTRSHTAERNYQCSECDKNFTNSSDLSKHNRVHDPNKQFKCSCCQRLFAQKSNMLSHMRRMHTI